MLFVKHIVYIINFDPSYPTIVTCWWSV